ncbi:MAG: multicopper oxidase domain-containing protein [Pseudomonadota bacterium]
MLRKLVLPALLLVASAAAAQDAGERPPFVDPPEVSSENGVLDTQLTVAPTTIEVGGQTVTTELYNGLFAPPTLRVRPGDKLLLNLHNRRGGTTNLHFHGTNVSPIAPGDDVYIEIPPEASYKYEVEFPPEHPQGLFWYHPHYHGTTEYQIGSGMSGLISVDGVLDPWPELKDITHRNIILRDIQIMDGKVPDPPDPGNPTLRTVNGQVNPTITIRPGEIQFWRVGNIGADIFYDLEIEGHQMHEIARDGIRHNQPVTHEHLLLPTSARTEFLVVGGAPGEYIFRTREIDMGPAGDPHPETTLATLVVSGPEQTDVQLPTSYPELPDLREATPCCERTFDFSETPDGNTFCINNVGTDMAISNTTVRIGCVERWTVNNCSAENHNFHHHQLQFQVIERNGQPVPFTGWQDTVTLDYRAATDEFPDRCKCDDDGANCTECTCPTAEDPHGSVVVLIPYLNPVIEGQAVYHCHIGEHEDNGMMQTITMSRDAGRCEPGTPSNVDRLSMTPSERAACAPREDHDHASADDGPWSLAALLKILDDPSAAFCLAPGSSLAQSSGSSNGFLPIGMTARPE